MATNEKFHAGSSYADAPKTSCPDPKSDPIGAAAAVVRDLALAGINLSPTECVNVLKALFIEKGQPTDDRKGTSEAVIGWLAALPNNSGVRARLTAKLVDTFWSDLDHPPLTFVGGDIKYELTASTDKPVNDKHEKYDSIEFEVPGTGVTLREEVPKVPHGTQYRMPDGSFNNILEPRLGAAGSPYAKSIRSVKALHGVRPDPGQLFDLLQARGENDFRENTAGISSILFYHASIIIHDIFRTSRTDMNKSDTSSYLDLAPLYGSSLRDQFKVRTMQGGKLKPDTFHEKRLLGQPAGVNVMLVLYSRYHNYVCDMLLAINEGDRFTLAAGPNASPEEKAKALAKQDHDLFNVARLITGAMYVSICLGDYLRAIMNLHSVETEWFMDPRVEIGPEFEGRGVPRGVGNVVSCEFNLLYRFHSCISKKDEQWTNNFLMKLIPGRKAEDLDQITLPELGAAFVAYEKSIPTEPCERTFDGLVRQADGRFKDEDLVRILNEGMQDPAGTFGANMVPKALKIIEIQGIKQARRWGCASLNEFREYFGLKRYEKFSDINSNEYIQQVLEKLYQHPDMVEMYPGMMIEDFKETRSPGIGVNPTYTVGRAVLADAVTLVRSDRFLTLDHTVSNLTAWGYREVERDPKVLGGSMLYKLIQRGIPGWFPFNAYTVMQPMYTKKANIEIAKRLGKSDLFTLDDPQPPRRPITITSPAAIKQVLDDHSKFRLVINKGMELLFRGKRDTSWFMLAGDEAINHKQRLATYEAFKVFPDLKKVIWAFTDQVASELIIKENFEFKNGVRQIDILRDFAIPLNAQLLGDMFYLDLKTNENPGGTLSHAALYRALINIRVWAAHNTDSAESWQRRRRATDSAKLVIDSTRVLVDEVSRGRGFGLGIASRISSIVSRQASLKKDSLRSYGFKLVDALLGQKNTPENVTDQLWLNAFGAIGNLVAAFWRIMDFFLKPENEAIWAQVQDVCENRDTPTLEKMVAEALRLTATMSTVRVATQATKLEGKQIPAGSLLVLAIANAARDPATVPNPETFDLNRTQPDVETFSYGQHKCLGKTIALAFLTGLVGTMAALKNLRPAAGAPGTVREIPVRFEKMFPSDDYSYLAHYPSNWKLEFDGIGKGTYHSSKTAQDNISMQEYYAMLQKEKAEAS